MYPANGLPFAAADIPSPRLPHVHCCWLAADQVYVLLGATSEMCPFATLMALGCTVVAVQRPSSRTRRLVDAARASPGTLILPVQHAGPASDLVRAPHAQPRLALRGTPLG